ncbi:MAG TPA: hypothetical protein PLE33_00295 [Candidatus Cloacimonas sp.]|nr:hypothetical protein [Candidatus Cloacimonas sp.]
MVIILFHNVIKSSEHKQSWHSSSALLDFYNDFLATMFIGRYTYFRCRFATK